jgi:TetR/AcrR family transcriptional repressor of nem operon
MAARKRDFDPETLLDTVVELFWVRGYGDCSMADVVEASGVARYGIYQEFGDKDALYRAALVRYRERAITMLNAELNTPEGGLAEIRGFFLGTSELVEQGDRRGCLVSQAALDRAQQDSKVADIVDAIMRDMRAAFGSAVEVGLAQGELRDLPKDVLVDYVVGLQRSLGVMVRTAAPIEDIQRYIEASLAMLSR